jgi:DNA modification methylase
MPDDYTPDEASGDAWRLLLGDSCERLGELDDGSVDLSIYSPPFASLYTYSPSARDIGNCRDLDEFIAHYRFVIDHVLRVTKPGRLSAVHLAQVATQLAKDGVIGLMDIRGPVIAAHQDAGWVYHGDITVDKNPQAQAIRTHSKGLLFVQLEKDSTWSRPALADYVLVFRKPGDNAVPVRPTENKQVTREEWIEWAHPCWLDIKETATLNAAEAREQADERHVCPLQLPLIDRCVRLWSNPGELVLSPFAGIGSEGYQSILRGRRFVGCELKRSYYVTAIRNLERAERKTAAPSLL